MNFRFPLASITITLKEWVKGMEELMFYLGNKQNILLNMEKKLHQSIQPVKKYTQEIL